VHDVLYAHQAALARDAAEAVARKLGLDPVRFAKALDDARLDARLDADMKKATAIGVNGTPTFLINGRVVIGARPVDALRAIVEEELARLK